MRISVVSPVLNEEKNIGAMLESLLPLKPDELIVVDGGSDDRTREICRQLGIEVLSSPRGRAKQMNYGAEKASGDVLMFLHADTKLPLTAFSDIREALEDTRCVAGRFDVRLEGNHWALGLVGRLISLRSRLSKISTGDQGIFIRRDVFQKIGGFPDIPIMEDVALCRSLKRVGNIACLRSRVITSARRWESCGVWRTILRMWTLKALYLLGVSPHRLKQFYSDAR